MSRARNLKPSFFKDEELVECGQAAMLLFAGLWTLADREGRLEDRPKLIKAEIFPYTDISVEAFLKVLDDKAFIVRYEVNGKKYIQIRSWHKHQKPHLKEAPSTYPAPPALNFPERAPEKPGNSGASTGNSGTRTPSTCSLQPSTFNPQPGTPAAPVAPPAPVDSLIAEICKEMRTRHRKTTGLGGMELERTLCTVAADAVDPPAVLRAIRDRWRLSVEREWASSESKYWPNLLEWIGRRRYLDPAPPERDVAGFERPTKSRLEAMIDAL